MSAPLSLITLGGLEIRQDGQPLGGLASRKAEALLVYLAMEDKPHAREVLADLLWDDRTTAQALGNLRVLLNSLRKHLGPELEISRQSVRLHRGPGWRLDALDVESHLLRGQARDAGLPLLSESAVEALEQAVAAYQGDFLQGVYLRESSRFEEWASLTRERLRLAAMTALENLIDFHKRCGVYPRAIRAVQHLLRFDPLREETHRQLMELLARNGQRQAALAQYAVCRDMLARELGVPPAPETELLYRKLNRAGSAYTASLPAYSTPFIGREADLKRITDCLRRPDCRWVTLYGPGGSGKTRLAAQSAAQLSGEFFDGVLFVHLTEPAEPLGLTLLEALSQPPAVRAEPLSQLAATLKERELLLVLDNLTAQGSDLALLPALLRAAPGVKLLLTMRLPTRLQDEWPLEVTGMDIPAKPDETAVNADAIQLFCQAAQRVQPGFQLDAQTLPQIVRICRLVMGAPLGIELAAGWLRLLSPAQVADAIQDDLSVLSSASPDLPERHRSFRALLDHTWALLTPREQDVFYQLAVFEGGFTLAAARQVAAAGLDELAGLVEKSLITRDATGRYAIHSLLRQHTLQRPAPHFLRGADPHHEFAAYYLAQAARSEPDLRGPRQQQALDALIAEQDNLRAAWQWAAAHRQFAMLAASLEALVAFYDARGHFHEASLLLEPLNDLEPGDFAGWVYAARGFFADRLAQYGQAQSFNQHSLELFEQTGNLRGQARALANLGMNAIYRGKLDDAAQVLQRALELTRQCGDEPGRGRSLSLLGVVHKQKGEYDPARRAQEEALLIFRTLDDPQRVAATANNLGSVLRAQGRLSAAQACYEENLSIRRALGDPRGTALALVNLANLLAQMGQAEAARQHYTESLTISEDLGDLWGRALCLHNLGDLARQQADYAQAARHYTDSLVLRRRVDDQTGMAYSLAGLGYAWAAQGDDARAMEYFQEAAQAALAKRLLPLMLDVLCGAAHLHAQAGSPARAQRLAAFLLSQPALEPHLAQAMRQILPTPSHPPPALDLAAVMAEAFELPNNPPPIN